MGKNSSITGYLKNQLDRKEIVDFFQKKTSKKENYKLSIYFLNFYLRRRICFCSLKTCSCPLIRYFGTLFWDIILGRYLGMKNLLWFLTEKKPILDQ